MKKTILNLSNCETSLQSLLPVRRVVADQLKSNLVFRTFIAFLFFIFISINHSSAQNYWVQAMGGGSQDEVNDVCTDLAGNIYSTGYFSSNAHFVNLSLNSASTNIADVFVSKTNASGAVQWAVNFGGAFDDRGQAIAVDNSGNVFVTGTFTGTANFGSTTLTADSLSKDVFIAKISNTGSILWAKRIGGPRGDIANDICVDNNGNATITGQFKATASFANNTVTSTLDTAGINYTYDIFIAKFDGAGTQVWYKTGGAKFDDRGMSISCDASNNLFVACQFSDTLQFGIYQIKNQVRNAALLLKLDANGNILANKKISASSVQPNSIDIDDSNNVVVVGDFTGNMVFWGTPNKYLTNQNPRKIFVAKFTNNLNYVWSVADGSKKMVSVKNTAIANDGSIFLYGQFGCTFTDYSNNYGDASFNSLGFSDLFLAKISNAGTRIWQRSMGGPKEDRAGGLAILPNNTLIFAGSFEDKLIIPVSNACTIYNHAQDLNLTLSGANNGISFCNDNSYGQFQYVNANALNDGFISNAIDISRAPLDYYERTYNSSNCLIPKLNQCIGTLSYLPNVPHTSPLFPWAHDCLNDTVELCEPNYYTINTKTGIPGYVSPYYTWNWNGANFNNPILYVNNTSQIILEMKTIDNCYTSYDTIQFIVHAKPTPPLLSDNYNINNQSPKFASDVQICATSANLIVTASGIGNNVLTWSTTSPIINQTANSVEINQEGVVTAVLTNSYGCTDYNRIELILDSVAPVFTPISDLADTITICNGDYVTMDLYDSLTNSNLAINCDGKFFASVNSTPPMQIVHNNCFTGQSVKLFPNQSGWHTIIVPCSKSNACGTTNHTLTKNVYVNLLPSFSILPSAPSDTIFFCPGNNINLNLSNNMVGNWNGPSINNVVSNAISTQAVGTYIAQKNTMTNPLASCIDTIVLAPDHAPGITLTPSNGIICPYDSVMLTSNLQGQSYQWFGPTGLLPQYTGISAYGSIAGKYYCKVLTFDGCIVVSLNAEIKQYNSPYLISNPTSTICNGQSTTIEVKANDEALIVWNSPLSGNSAFQTISQPGLYSCSSTLCNITTSLSITITGSQDSVSILGPDTLKICPGQVVTITATSGMSDYNWSSGDAGQTITTSNAGSYQIFAIAPNGCEVESNTVFVVENPSVPNPTVTGDTVCVGANATLFAISNSPVQWFNQEFGGIVVSNLDSIIINSLMNDSIFFVQAIDSIICNSERVMVTASVYQANILPAIYGDSIICNNHPISISTDSLSNTVYSWTGPNGFTSSAFSFTTITPGNYSLNMNVNNCGSLTTNVHISSSTTTMPTIIADSTFCEGDTIQLLGLANGVANSYHWVSSNNSSSDSLIFKPSASIADSGLYSFYFNANGCNSDTVSINILINPTPIISLDSVFRFCANKSDSIILQNSNNYNITWSMPNGDTASTNGIYFNNVDTSIAGIYSVVAEHNGCNSRQLHTEIIVNSVTNPVVSFPQTICEGDTLSLNITNLDSSIYYFNINNQISFSTYADTILPGVDTTLAGSIMVYAQKGFCLSDSINLNLTVHSTPMPVNINGITNICGIDTINLFTDSISNASYQWNGPNGFNSNTQHISIYNANGMSQSEGMYFLNTINQFGCKSSVVTKMVTINELPILNIGNDTTICNNQPFMVEPNNSFVSYQWSNGNISSSQLIDSSATISLLVQDANGCEASDTISVTVLNCDLTLQNVFSPDGDGVNDYFTLASDGFVTYNISVYDRWGLEVYQSNSQSKAWDGKNKLGNYVDAGTYYFTVEATDIANHKGFWKSYVSVIK